MIQYTLFDIYIYYDRLVYDINYYFKSYIFSQLKKKKYQKNPLLK